MRLSLVPVVLVAALAAAAPLAAQGGIPWEDPPERRMTVKQPVAGEWMLGADGGWTTFLPPEFQERGTRFALFAERNVLPWLGLQADVSCARGTLRGTFLEPESEISVCTGALSAVVPIPVSYALWPYVRLGAGYAFWDENPIEGVWDLDATEPALVAAIGTRYFPLGNDKIALRLDISRTQTSLSDLSVGLWGVGLGVALRIP